MEGLSKREKTEKGTSGIIRPSEAHATLIAYVKEEPVRIMIDSGASSSYTCTDLITKLGIKPKEQRCIEQMYGTIRNIVKIYKVTIASKALKGFKVDIECINAEKDVLTYVPNSNIQRLKMEYPRLRRLDLCEENTIDETLPVHIMLGVVDYQRIRTNEPPVLGLNTNTDPVQGGHNEFKQLCSLDVLGLEEQFLKEFDHQGFKDQIIQTIGGYYKTKLPWKIEHSPLPNNKELTRKRLIGMTKRLERNGKLDEYHEVMTNQLNSGVLEPIPDEPTGNTVHYVPHHPVIKEDAETTKLRIVYDCSSKVTNDVPSLNECLETGPALQPKLFDILIYVIDSINS